MDDTSFHECIQLISEEPTPYYSQIASKPEVESPEMSDTELPKTPPPSEEEEPDQGRESKLTETRLSQVALSVRSQSPPQRAPSLLSESSPNSPRLLDQEEATGTETKEEELVKFRQKCAIKKTAEFGLTVESLLENTIMNVLQEAFSQEFNITARPRLVAMLPRSATPRSNASNRNVLS